VEPFRAAHGRSLRLPFQRSAGYFRKRFDTGIRDLDGWSCHRKGSSGGPSELKFSGLRAPATNKFKGLRRFPASPFYFHPAVIQREQKPGAVLHSSRMDWTSLTTQQVALIATISAFVSAVISSGIADAAPSWLRLLTGPMPAVAI
jgi:hypothetical protein